MRKRKYTRSGEKPSKFQCTNKKCKWEGTQEEKAIHPLPNGWEEYVCPKCKNNEFYGLI